MKLSSSDYNGIYSDMYEYLGEEIVRKINRGDNDMIIETKLVENVARAAHPYGCKESVMEQINNVKSKGSFEAPKKVLILGASD